MTKKKTCTICRQPLRAGCANGHGSYRYCGPIDQYFCNACCGLLYSAAPRMFATMKGFLSSWESNPGTATQEIARVLMEIEAAASRHILSKGKKP